MATEEKTTEQTQSEQAHADFNSAVNLAALALQGLLARPGIDIQEAPKLAVQCAIALIGELQVVFSKKA